MADFKKGDRVAHRQIPQMRGKFVRYGKPIDLGPERGTQRQVWWVADKDYNPFRQCDYTWEDCMMAENQLSQNEGK